jgi:hypothetical protein
MTRVLEVCGINGCQKLHGVRTVPASTRAHDDPPRHAPLPTPDKAADLSLPVLLGQPGSSASEPDPAGG